MAMRAVAAAAAACAVVGSAHAQFDPAGGGPVAQATIWRDATTSVLPMAATSGRSMDIEVADLDGDGRLDLVIASEFGQNLVLFGGDDGVMARRPGAFPPGRRHDSEDIAIADVDGDGRLDLVFAAEDDRVDELHLQRSRGVFTDATDRLPTPAISNCVLAADLNGDGHVDLVFGSAGAPAAPGQQAAGAPDVLLLGDGTGRFTPAPPEMFDGGNRCTQDLELGDLDGDGDLDLVAGNEDGLRMLRNDAGRFVDATAAWAPAGMPAVETREIDLGDVDGDGDLDAVLANVGWRPGVDPTNRLWLNDGTGRMVDVTAERMPRRRDFSLDADFADLDADGDLDLIIANLPSGAAPTPPIMVWINDGSGHFEDRTNRWVPPLGLCRPIDVEAVDLDGDGRLDLLVANHGSSDLVLLTGPDPGPLTGDPPAGVRDADPR